MKCTVLLIFFTCFTFTYGQNTDEREQDDYQDWQLRVGPYLWFLGINGTITNPPFYSVQPIDRELDLNKSYNEINNSLIFGLSLNVEYHKKRWTGIVSFATYIFDGKDNTPDEIIQLNYFYRWEQTFGEAKVGYRFLQRDNLHLDGFVGAQINFFQIYASFQAGRGDTHSGQTSDYSIDPIIAARFTYIPHNRIELGGTIDYGGFGGTLTNQYKLEARFLLAKWLYLSPGYKYWLYKQDVNESTFNGQFSGFYLRFGVQI